MRRGRDASGKRSETLKRHPTQPVRKAHFGITGTRFYMQAFKYLLKGKCG